MGWVQIRLLGTTGFHVKAKNERFTAVSFRCRQNLKYENFMSSFGRLRQNIAQKSVPHVQHDYFSSFSQSNHWFVAVLLTLPSSNLKLPFVCSETPALRFNSCRHLKVLFKHVSELGPFVLDGANYMSMVGNQMMVHQTGLYYVYGQVHYIHLNSKRLYNRCQLQINNVPFRFLQKGMDGRADIGNVYSGGMVPLKSGDRIRLVTQTEVHINMDPRVTFFGAFRVGFGCHECGHYLGPLNRDESEDYKQSWTTIKSKLIISGAMRCWICLPCICINE